MVDRTVLEDEGHAATAPVGLPAYVSVPLTTDDQLFCTLRDQNFVAVPPILKQRSGELEKAKKEASMGTSASTAKMHDIQREKQYEREPRSCVIATRADIVLSAAGCRSLTLHIHLTKKILQVFNEPEFQKQRDIERGTIACSLLAAERSLTPLQLQRSCLEPGRVPLTT